MKVYGKRVPRLKHGFSITILNRKFTLFFEYFNEIVVKAHLIDDDFENEFIGTSKCHIKQGDIYNKETGEMLSAQKAIDKWALNYERELNQVVKEDERLIDEISFAIMRKLTKITNIKINV